MRDKDRENLILSETKERRPVFQGGKRATWSAFTGSDERKERGSRGSPRTRLLRKALLGELTFNLIKLSRIFFYCYLFLSRAHNFKGGIRTLFCSISPGRLSLSVRRVKFLRKKCAKLAWARLVKNVKLTVGSSPELCNFQDARVD